MLFIIIFFQGYKFLKITLFWGFRNPNRLRFQPEWVKVIELNNHRKSNCKTFLSI